MPSNHSLNKFYTCNHLSTLLSLSKALLIHNAKLAGAPAEDFTAEHYCGLESAVVDHILQVKAYSKPFLVFLASDRSVSSSPSLAGSPGYASMLGLKSPSSAVTAPYDVQ